MLDQFFAVKGTRKLMFFHQEPVVSLTSVGCFFVQGPRQTKACMLCPHGKQRRVCYVHMANKGVYAMSTWTWSRLVSLAYILFICKFTYM